MEAFTLSFSGTHYRSIFVNHFKFKIPFTNSLSIDYLFWEIISNSLSFSRIHFELTFFREFALDFLSSSENNFKFTIFFANSLRIRYLFLQFTWNSLSFSLIRIEFTIHSVNPLSIYYLSREFTSNSLSF